MSDEHATEVIKNKVRLLKLADTLGSASQACKVMGFSPDSFTGFASCTKPGEGWLCKRSAVVSPS
jgi:hypothetical protein